MQLAHAVASVELSTLLQPDVASHLITDLTPEQLDHLPGVHTHPASSSSSSQAGGGQGTSGALSAAGSGGAGAAGSQPAQQMRVPTRDIGAQGGAKVPKWLKLK